MTAHTKLEIREIVGKILLSERDMSRDNFPLAFYDLLQALLFNTSIVISDALPQGIETRRTLSSMSFEFV